MEVNKRKISTIRVNLGKRSYDIIIGPNLLNSAGEFIGRLNGTGRDAYIVSNVFLKRTYAKFLVSSLKRAGFSIRFKTIPDGEKFKCLDIALKVIKDIANCERGRRFFVIAFGGGVIGDLTGFVASIYKRGLPYIQIPTTFLAQVDSAIGGKTAVDLKQGKNLLGSFYQPRLVISDIGCLKSLSLRQMKTGLSEIVKYGLIKDGLLFEYLEENYEALLNRKEQGLRLVIERCSRIKAQIVTRDEREEKGIRTILNFGHTVGHAIEAAGNYNLYNHGEAIAIGMLCAKDISQRMGFLKKGCSERIENLISAIGLPTRIKKIGLGQIIKAYYRDKKFIGPTNRFVLIRGIGRPFIKEDIRLDLIKEVIRSRL
jgi:3-dehydroquinate synthase